MYNVSCKFKIGDIVKFWFESKGEILYGEIESMSVNRNKDSQSQYNTYSICGHDIDETDIKGQYIELEFVKEFCGNVEDFKDYFTSEEMLTLRRGSKGLKT